MYKSKLNLWDTENGIKMIKDFFQEKLSDVLALRRVSAPLFVSPKSGLNDGLSGKERPVSFENYHDKSICEVVQSLAKWKRMAIYRYDCFEGKGIYADMNAIRRDEILDSTHSIYVDQWDWEKHISKSDRNMEYLKSTVRSIYRVLLATQAYICAMFPNLNMQLPNDITFIDSQDLLNLYPNLSPEEREDEIAKKHRAVFITRIGHKLSDGKLHSKRAADYDDWNLNGDLILFYEPLNKALELSSMGIRVDGETLLKQSKIANKEDKLTLDYHKKLIAGELPATIGGGIGQSRMCMFFLEKIHIGEVQASYWPKDMAEDLDKKGIFLL